MENRTSLQDSFLNEVRREKIPVTVYLTNGFQQRGTVFSFDEYTVLLWFEGKQYLIYKHAISTILPQRSVPAQQ
ncbi:MAG: RNA chaperone Hfq [Clostridia bacterium]|nr:RNA chaperone Hfq [Clostridia bacterium]